MEKVIIETEVTTGNSVGDVAALTATIGKLTDQIQVLSEQLNGMTENTDQTSAEIKRLQGQVKNLEGQLEKTTKGLKNTEQQTGALVKGLKGIGLAIKAVGIGLLLELMAAVKEIFMSNQTVVDKFSSAMNFLKIAFNDLVDFISDNFDDVVGFFKGIFEDPQQAIEDFANLIKENLIERFNSFVDTLGYVGTAIKELFSGNFSAAADAAKMAGKELVDVATGVNNSFDRTVSFVKDAATVIADYTGKTWASAKALTAQANSAAIALANNRKLKEEYDQQAERFRQIRDDETKSIEDRIKANDDLAATLQKQSELMIQNADLVIARADAQYKLNKSVENEIKLIDAKTEKAAILAQIEGQRSEQLMNDMSLQREREQMSRTIADGDAERAAQEAEFAADLADLEAKKTGDFISGIKARQEAARIAAEEEEARLTKQRDQYVEGTLAYAEADNELKNARQENANEQLEFDRALAEEEKKIADQKLQQASNLAGAIASLAGEQTAVGKAAAVAQTTIDTYSSATKSYNSLSGIPYVGPILGGIAAAAAVVNGIANVKRILAVNPKSKNQSAPSAGSMQVPALKAPPIQGLTQGAGDIQLGNQKPQPQRVYVVESDIRNTQNRVDVINQNATLG